MFVLVLFWLWQMLAPGRAWPLDAQLRVPTSDQTCWNGAQNLWGYRTDRRGHFGYKTVAGPSYRMALIIMGES